jgi:hypothetical protein
MLPTTRLGSLEVTRLVIGGNPFSGHSHWSAERSREMVDWYTAARIKQTLQEAEAAGINTFLGRADNHIMRLLHEYWQEGGGIQWIAQTAPERASVEANIDQAIGAGARAVYLHGGMVDTTFRAGRFDDLVPWVEHIRERGVPAGLATHNTEVLRHAVGAGLPVDFFCACFYDIYLRGEVYLPEDREAMSALVRGVEKPCVAYKIMAAGRNDPEEAFAYAYRRIKPIDTVCVGMFTRDHATQVAENAAYGARFSALSHAGVAT